MSHNKWLTPSEQRDRQEVTFRTRDGSPAKASIERYTRDRHERRSDGYVYEREDYRRLRFWKGRANGHPEGK